MKYIICSFILFLSISTYGQREPNRLYVGAMLHDLNDIGGMALYSFGPAKYVGVGAGIEVTGWRGNTMIPIYADLRFRHQFNRVEPFLGVQAGRPVHNGRAKMEDGTRYRGNDKISGQFFFGGVGGISISIKKLGLFASYGYRQYQMRYYERNEEGIIEHHKMSVVTIGIRI